MKKQNEVEQPPRQNQIRQGQGSTAFFLPPPRLQKKKEKGQIMNKTEG